MIFNPKLYDHKANRAGVSYELVLLLKKCKIISINGPFDASTSDLTMFRDKVKAMIPDGYKLIGDRLFGARAERGKLSSKSDNHDKETAGH